MSSELLEGRLAPADSGGPGMGQLNQPPRHTQPLPCPRCNSINTKFCYYNNYNSSQPRYFCKTCRRYWTQGGTLRNVPVGGGTRKKRSRPTFTTSSPTSTATSLSASSCTTTATSALASSASAEFANSEAMASADLNLNEKLSTVAGGEENGNFLSLLRTQGIYVPGFGFMGINNNGGYGPSFGHGACEMGLGFDGNGVLPYAGMAYNGGAGSIPAASAAGAAGGGHGDLSMSEASQGRDAGRTSGDGWVDDADGFVWPELAISMPGAKV